LTRVIDLAVSVPLGLIFFLASAKLFHLSELESARRALVVPLARRFGWDRVKI